MFLKNVFVCGVFSLMTSSCFFKHKKHEMNPLALIFNWYCLNDKLLNMSEVHSNFEQWCFDQQKNDLKQLMVQYEDLDVRLELIECLYAQWDPKQKETVEKLKKRVTKLEEYVRKLEDRVEIIDEGDGIRLNLLEEKVAALNTQNIELRNLNLT